MVHLILLCLLLSCILVDTAITNTFVHPVTPSPRKKANGASSKKPRFDDSTLSVPFDRSPNVNDDFVSDNDVSLAVGGATIQAMVQATQDDTRIIPAPVDLRQEQVMLI